ncbi:DDE 3 domain-containing protein [Aphis craccivora]|uniref:DDE 3 domain-containing protein n=1 Tax=Aphis craccivora TaxID=307492 RepID=A0A6G0VX68_APHCR|nr:DDE 3 domain-containing protein [Aphis craccivora]
MERNDIVAMHVKFLLKMCNLRQSNDTRPVVYLDETWVNQNNSRGQIWQNAQNMEGLKVPTGKGGRLLICHVGSRWENIKPKSIRQHGVKKHMTLEDHRKYLFGEVGVNAYQDNFSILRPTRDQYRYSTKTRPISRYPLNRFHSTN